MCVCVCVCVCMYKCGKSKQCYNGHMHNTILRIYLRNVTKFEKFTNWKLKKFVTYTSRKFLPVWNFVTSPPRWKYTYQNSLMKTHSYRHFNPVMPSGDKRSYKLKKTCREKLQICLNVCDVLLPPGIKGINSHKNHSVISRLIIDSINYWNAILNSYL